MSNHVVNYDFVKKVLGPVTAAGETHIDEKRMANLEATIDLAQRLIADIAEAGTDRFRPEHSMNQIGRRAWDFLESLAAEITEEEAE